MPETKSKGGSRPKGAESAADPISGQLASFAAPRPRVTPPQDPEVAALLADERRRNPPPPRRPRSPEDPEVTGSRMAERLLAAEAIQRREESDRRRGVAPRPGAERPIQVTPRLTLPDLTAEGKEFVKPGWISRWVRKYDDFGRPTENPLRLRMFKAYGYIPVLDDEGQEIHGPFGILMQASPENYARRVRDMAPEGAVNRSLLADTMRTQVEETNSQVGREVVQMIGDGAQDEAPPEL